MKLPVLFLAVAASASAQNLKPPVIGEQVSGLPPKKALEAFRAYEGFKVVQSAAEPDVRQPVAMTIDERGRVWIAEAYEYPIRAKGDTGKDRILIFEDKDGDGVFDERKVFTEGLNLVSGLEVGFGGVWVGAAPYLMFIPDADGDDKPDGKPEILLDGFGWHDTHETLNAFNWGPDGWLYGCHGVFTHSKVGKPGTADDQRIPMNAAVWRFHPQRREFEVFAHGSSNPWGVDFNDHGQAFITACVIPHLYHVIQGARYQRQAGQHFDPHTYDDIKTCADHLHYKGDQWQGSRDGSSSDFGGGHAHCGLSIYLGDNFPDQFRGKLLFNNLHGHRVNQERVERRGSGYVGKHEPDFLFSNDKQHMGVSLRYGPDGGMYLTDWYDEQTCHNVNGEVWDRSNGRIYKITYGTPEVKSVDLKKSTDAELVAFQMHKNDWFVRTARRMLQQRAADGTLDRDNTVTGLRKMLSHADETRGLRAMWALHVINGLDEAALLELTAHQGEYVRAWAIQLLSEKKNAGPLALKRFAEMAATDASAMVRLYLAAALQRMEPAKRGDIAMALLAHGEDAEDHNLPLMIWYGVSDIIPQDGKLAQAMILNSRIPKVTRFIVRRMAETPEGRDAVIGLVAVNADKAGLVTDVLSGLSMALSKSGALPAAKGWAESSEAFIALKSPEARRDFELVATVFGDKRMADRFLKAIGDLSAKKEDRSAALENLMRMAHAGMADLLLKLAANEADPQRVEWIRALGRVPDERIPAFLMETFSKLDTVGKEAAVQSLGASEGGARKLAEALTAGKITRGGISAFVARQMRGYDQPDITAAVEKHWGAISAGQAEDKLKEIERLAKTLNPKVLAKADLRNGRKIYQSTCFACHQLFGDGMKLGPDLTGSNRADTKYLLENIIDPGSLVGLDYQLHTIVKKDGQVVAGLLKDRTVDVLGIAVIGGGQVTVPVSDIKDHKVSTTSMMPEGLIANLTSDETRDLIGYLQSPRQVPLPVEGEIIIGDDLLKVAEVNRGTVQKQNMEGFKAASWSGDSHLWWTQGETGDRIVIQFESAVEGNYAVSAVFTKAHDYGIFRVKLNGVTVVENIDLYNKGTVITTGDVDLGKQPVKKGLNQLVVELLGANPAASQGKMFGIDHLHLVPE
ncbi:MAG: c-type cytochrome [Akkermansiaceae bacterium]|nr:c-type cytochrome [Akkermansiaceae bacterium]